MLRALGEYRVEGIQTNLKFFRSVLTDGRFRSGDFDTGFIEAWQQRSKNTPTPTEMERDLAAIAAALQDSEEAPEVSHDAAYPSQWKATARLRGLRR
jgi:acetyl/propionyl-CoA carboxylase alpha subunit